MYVKHNKGLISPKEFDFQQDYRGLASWKVLHTKQYCGWRAFKYNPQTSAASENVKFPTGEFEEAGIQSRHPNGMCPLKRKLSETTQAFMGRYLRGG